MPPQPEQVFLFDMMRHRSHLFFRYLGTHPDVQTLWHPFLPAALFGPERITRFTKNEGPWISACGTVTYADVTKDFLHAIGKAKDQKNIFVANEHCQMVCKQDLTLAVVRNQPTHFPANPTVIPDDLFATLTPIFIIRNPVFAVPSNYAMLAQTSQQRLGGEDWKLVTSMPLQRRLFDHFRERDGRPPLVIDGDDVVWRTGEVRDQLSHALGIAAGGWSSTWKAVPQDQRHEHPIVQQFLQTIDDSTGIERSSDQSPDADLEKAYGRWVDRYGEEVASVLRSTVEQNMPHYEYMARFKM